MAKIASRFDQLDQSFIAFMARFGVTLLRLSVGIVFLWFGFLKFYEQSTRAFRLRSIDPAGDQRGYSVPIGNPI